METHVESRTFGCNVKFAECSNWRSQYSRSRVTTVLRFTILMSHYRNAVCVIAAHCSTILFDEAVSFLGNKYIFYLFSHRRRCETEHNQINHHRGRRSGPVSAFKYMGIMVSEEGTKPEDLSGIALTKAASARLRPMWNENIIALNTKNCDHIHLHLRL